MDLLEEYQRRLAMQHVALAEAGSRAGTLLMATLAAGAVVAGTGWRLVEGVAPVWPVGVALVAAVVCAVLWQRARAGVLRSFRLVEFYRQGVARMTGEQVQSGLTGDAAWTQGHLYARDLDVLGEASLFGMLATTRTGLGERALAALLLEPVSAPVVRARQAAVKELAPQLDLRERVVLLGWAAGERLAANSFAQWLRGPVEGEVAGLAIWMRWVLVGLTLAWMGAIAITIALHGAVGEALRNGAALLAMQGAFCLWLRPRVAAELEMAQRLPKQVDILRQGLRLLGEQNFTSPLLRELRVGNGAEDALGGLAISLTLVEQRAKEWYYAPAVMLAVGTHAAISLSVWRGKHAAAMRDWAAAWGTFEAMLAVGTYAAEHVGNVYPELVSDGPATFECEALWHPLLPKAMAVANDVQVGAGARFLLISGSNMAGKSTLLRAVGTNVVLALAGAPVCARRVRMSALRLGASLSVTDSLAEGKSKFLAEVERLRDLVALARDHPGQVLFVIDEIFSGTNSADRRIAAEAVVRGLVEAGAVGALSTHDLLLAALAEDAGLHGRNVHMASPSEADPLGFDYLLKDGVNRMTNGLAIVRMLGL